MLLLKPLSLPVYLPRYLQRSPSFVRQHSMRPDLFTVNDGDFGTTQQVNKVKVEPPPPKPPKTFPERGVPLVRLSRALKR